MPTGLNLQSSWSVSTRAESLGPRTHSPCKTLSNVTSPVTAPVYVSVKALRMPNGCVVPRWSSSLNPSSG